MTEPTPSETQAQIFKAARESWMQAAASEENRASGRAPCTAPARVTPVDESGRVIGEPRAAQLRDLSDDGVGLLMAESLQAAYLYLEVPYNVHETLSVSVRVVYCHPSDKGYQVGCQIMWPTLE